ncbi:MAG: hypothetical protein JW745_06895 [Sedimentisphaerales bacterium]|nr:hypothetical protein [Sedimentisphaerales bacterium]MBN2843237.1 hypothetical protein [Sedimentisphaerales bacterium]
MNEDHFKNMCESACYGIVRTNRQGCVEYINGFARRILGVPEGKQMDMMPFSDYIPLREVRIYNKIFNIYPDIVNSSQRANEGFLEPTHLEFEKPDNNMTMSILIKLSIVPYYVNNELTGFNIWINDITRRKKLLTQLDQAEKLASLATLASGIAHHFNNIIGGVATFADFALSGNNHQAHQRALMMTIEAADRISNITSSLLTFAEQDSREVEKTDLAEILRTYCHMVEKRLCSQNIILELKIDPVPYYEVPGTKMHQVLSNIIDNSSEAMPSGGILQIHLYRDTDNIILKFRDNGCGIEPDHLPHIFNPFFTTRGVGSNGHNSHNNGLGLSVVYGIVKELGGSISVASELDKWSEFVIKLPISRN